MKDFSTVMGGPERTFPATRWALLEEAGEGRAGALDDLARLYWRPVYAYLRRRWGKSNEEAKDLTQEFFLRLSGKDILRRLHPERGSFRSYVKAALDNFVRLERRKSRRLRRGGGRAPLSLDGLRGFEPESGDSPDRVFLREWAGGILDDALDALERDCLTEPQRRAFRIFLLHDVERPPEADLSYEGLARQFEMTVSEVTHALYNCRKKLRDRVLETVRGSSGSPSAAAAELKRLWEGFA